MADTKYCYPNSSVLINRLNILDQNTLSEFERRIFIIRQSEIINNTISGAFDYEHLKAIHKALFSDVYDWAGKERLVELSKEKIQFATIRYLEQNAKKIFDDLRRDNYTIGMTYDKTIQRLAYYLGEINVLHPFREGNGRTQRMFIYYLAKASGIELDFSKCTPEDMLNASIYSAQTGNNSNFEAILRNISKPISLHEQKAYLYNLSNEAFKVFTTINPVDRTESLKKMSLAEFKNEIINNKSVEQSLNIPSSDDIER